MPYRRAHRGYFVEFVGAGSISSILYPFEIVWFYVHDNIVGTYIICFLCTGNVILFDESRFYRKVCVCIYRYTSRIKRIYTLILFVDTRVTCNLPYIMMMYIGCIYPPSFSVFPRQRYVTGFFFKTVFSQTVHCIVYYSNFYLTASATKYIFFRCSKT